MSTIEATEYCGVPYPKIRCSDRHLAAAEDISLGLSLCDYQGVNTCAALSAFADVNRRWHLIYPSPAQSIAVVAWLRSVSLVNELGASMYATPLVFVAYVPRGPTPTTVMAFFTSTIISSFIVIIMARVTRITSINGQPIPRS